MMLSKSAIRRVESDTGERDLVARRQYNSGPRRRFNMRHLSGGGGADPPDCPICTNEMTEDQDAEPDVDVSKYWKCYHCGESVDREAMEIAEGKGEGRGSAKMKRIREHVRNTSRDRADELEREEAENEATRTWNWREVSVDALIRCSDKSDLEDLDPSYEQQTLWETNSDMGPSVGYFEQNKNNNHGRSLPEIDDEDAAQCTMYGQGDGEACAPEKMCECLRAKTYDADIHKFDWDKWSEPLVRELRRRLQEETSSSSPPGRYKRKKPKKRKKQKKQKKQIFQFMEEVI